jgi:hypothetical protein
MRISPDPTAMTALSFANFIVGLACGLGFMWVFIKAVAPTLCLP